MKQFIDEFLSVQGVTGAYIYSAKGHVIANNLPGVFKEAKLVNIGKVLAKLYSAGGLTFPDISDVFLSYEESVVIIREVGDKSYLIILCEPSLNVNLVTLTMNLIKDDLADAIKSLPSPSGPQAVSPAAPAAPKKPGSAEQPVFKEPDTMSMLKGKELMEKGPLADLLQGMQAALAKVIGPMAKIIFQESLEKWQVICLPSFNSVPKLVDVIALEIMEADKVADYRNLIKSLISNETE
jgi:predicted regulator of Ras-like GTPase activity (Roadblock/LC7/MglB family)